METTKLKFGEEDGRQQSEKEFYFKECAGNHSWVLYDKEKGLYIFKCNHCGVLASTQEPQIMEAE